VCVCVQTFVNERTLSLLPPSSQRRLLTLLPACDRVLSPIDRYTLTYVTCLDQLLINVIKKSSLNMLDVYKDAF